MLRLCPIGDWKPHRRGGDDPTQSAMDKYNCFSQQMDDMDFKPTVAGSGKDVDALIFGDCDVRG